MTRILDPQLHVAPVDGKPGRRRLVVTYLLDVPDGDDVIGDQVHEDAVVPASRPSGRPGGP